MSSRSALSFEDARRRFRLKKDGFFRRLLVADAGVQAAAAARVTDELRALVDGGHRAHDEDNEDDVELFLSDFLPTCVRLATAAPFAPIREAFADLLDHVAAALPDAAPMVDELRRASLCASRFVDDQAEAEAGDDAALFAVQSVARTDDEELLQLFRASFLRTGRISKLTQILGWHKSYLELFERCAAAIMLRDDGGALPLPWRNYIALMAASELRCRYLADLQQDAFIANAGDDEWMRGIDYVSPKLFRLHELSSLLAHRPWMITERHIGELLRGSRRHRSSLGAYSEYSEVSDSGNNDDGDNEDEDEEDGTKGCWSVAELVHAILVMCQFHSMSSIAMGVGCAEEVDLGMFSDFGDALALQQYLMHHDEEEEDENDENDENERPEDENQLEAAEEPSLALEKIEGDAGSSSASEPDIAAIERDEEMLLKRLKKYSGHDDSDTADEEEEEDGNQDEGEDEDEDLNYYDRIEPALEQTEEEECKRQTARRRDTLWRFCGGSVLRYEDFDVRSDAYKVLHTEDFSWDEHCFSLVRKYFPGEAGQILEDLFNLISKLTYDFFGARQEAEVDTSPYRDAVWFYVHRIFGICHDDYDYRQVNEYLDQPTKIFLKKVACTPWKVRRRDFEHFDRALSNSEKCHVVLIVAEARKQAGLMFALRAVMNYMR